MALKTLGEYLSESNISNADIAAIVGCSAQYIGLIIGGKKRPSWKMALRLEKATLGAVSRENWYPSASDYEPAQ